MSAGPGQIMQSILMAIKDDDAGAFTVDDLCRFAFPDIQKHQKKHRVTVTRALRSVVERSNDLTIDQGFRLGSPGRGLLILIKQSSREAAILELRQRKIWLANDQESWRWVLRRFNPYQH